MHVLKPQTLSKNKDILMSSTEDGSSVNSKTLEESDDDPRISDMKLVFQRAPLETFLLHDAGSKCGLLHSINPKILKPERRRRYKHTAPSSDVDGTNACKYNIETLEDLNPKKSGGFELKRCSTPRFLWTKSESDSKKSLYVPEEPDVLTEKLISEMQQMYPVSNTEISGTPCPYVQKPSQRECPSQSQPRKECPSQPKKECPSQPKKECPSQPKKECPSQPKKECPSQPKKECPSQPKKECPSQPKKECPSQPRKECPRQPKKECPSQPRKECPRQPKKECPRQPTATAQPLLPLYLDDIPKYPLRGREYYYNWKPVLDALVIKEQKAIYKKYVDKYPHLPELNEEDFKFNPATVKMCMEKAKRWDSLVKLDTYERLSKARLYNPKHSNVVLVDQTYKSSMRVSKISSLMNNTKNEASRMINNKL